jgi:DNA-binding transcriptional LysR family regulator
VITSHSDDGGTETASTGRLRRLQSAPVTPELRQLRYFVAVAEHDSLATAARSLHIAQQSLSQQLAVLERAVGVRLVDRGPRGARLTELGRVFVPEARAVLARADSALTALHRAARGETGQLDLVFLGTTANSMLPPVVRAIRERYPDIRVRTDDASIAELVAGLREGRWDAAFTRPPHVPDLATRTLATEQVCAVLPVGHRLADRDELALAELADEPWVLTPRESWPPWHTGYDRDFQAAGFTPDVVTRAASVPNLLGLVAAGVGVTRLAASSRGLSDADVVFVPLVDDVVETVVAWRPDDRRPLLGSLLSLVTELAQETDLLGRNP